MNGDDFGDNFSLPDGDREPFQQMTFTLADHQAEEIKEAMKTARESDGFDSVDMHGNENGNGNALYFMVNQWAGQRK